MSTEAHSLQAIFDQVPVAMLIVDAIDGTLLHANRPAAQLMNLPYPVPTIGADWKLAAVSFQSMHSDGRQHSGVGLGLAIAKQLVELHGGSIVAKSEGEGKGATFTATLPLPKSSTEQRDSPTHLHPLSKGVNNLRVLLVEDDSGSRLATCRALELRGAVMDAVPNASLAMASYTQTRPDAMILDIGLPAEDGYSLIARLRELETKERLSRVPAIALTAFARTHDRERAFAAGFDEHLAKPVDIETLVAALLRLTRRDRS